MPNSPFGAYLRERRLKAGLSLREVADALSISHVYLGEVERGRRRTLPEKYWEVLSQTIPDVSVPDLSAHNAASEPIDPAMVEGRKRDLVIALARRLEDGDMSEDLAAELLKMLENGGAIDA